MSDDWRELASCRGKHGYESAAQAHAVAGKYATGVYRCKFCGLWHVGAMRRWTKRRRRR